MRASFSTHDVSRDTPVSKFDSSRLLCYERLRFWGAWMFITLRSTRVLAASFSVIFLCGFSEIPFFSFEEPVGQVIGSYSKGTLTNPSVFPREGEGFTHLFHYRNRYYGSSGLIDILKKSAAELFQAYPEGERLQLGDLSAERGGFVSGHASHQNGLDVDLVYLRMNYEEQDPSIPNGFQESFVVKGKVTRNFDFQRNWRFFQIVHSSGRLNRIFVAPEIKEALCHYAGYTVTSEDEVESAIQVLRRLRPYKNHADHMHLRLTCPETSPDCNPQEEMPEGSGCNSIRWFEVERELP